MSELQGRRIEDDAPSTTSALDSRSKPKSKEMASTSEDTRHWAKPYRTVIASSSSSILATLAVYPFDSVKTRMQAVAFKGPTDCFKRTFRSEGIKGFYRGSLAPVFSITLVRTICFSVYQTAKYKYSAAIGRATGGDEPLVVVNRLGSYPSLATLACFGAAGATAGAAASAIACPFELTKNSAQISTLMVENSKPVANDGVLKSYEHKGTFMIAKNIIKHRGIMGLYSGYQLHLLRDTYATGIYFITYESVKQLTATFQGSSSPTSPGPVAVAGGLCGLVSWAATYPIDTAKSQYQRDCLSVGKGVKVKMPKIEWLNKEMYRGLGVSMARSCIANAILFSSFEYVKKKINALEDPVSAGSKD
ncbi:Mitochondrial substrate/solute carrier [Lasallia pustulata]|uniref:Mitochondrial substrate/solute carrier n=1 Tax=Lasallia pustulata TaxID=136370 RepID=A0A1W5CTE2_9LECA|nr:Mitochondrial substrate/solute carrier [Lasallia pustulata]